MRAQYGLIGKKLGHSFSEKFFSDKFCHEGIEVSYRNFELESIDKISGMLRENPNLQGFNVTIPYKQEIIPYLTDIEGVAKEIMAVNCVKVVDGKLYGYNTDVYGFRRSLLGFIGDNRPKALVLGTGGASKAVDYVLKESGIVYRTVSRSNKNGDMTYDDIKSDPTILSSCRLIVNTTPLGMYPDIETAPDIPYDVLTPEHYLFDLVYNPERTLFMKKGEEYGARTINGYEMLVGQAERSWDIWTGKI